MNQFSRKKMPKDLRLMVYAKCGGRCAYCGNPIKYEEMQVDHLNPLKGDLSTSETDVLGNLMPSCPVCNRKKSSLTLEEFRKYIEVDAPRIHFQKNRKWYADADKICDAYHLHPGVNEVMFYFERKGTKKNERH